jgi:hypothetical protein
MGFSENKVTINMEKEKINTKSNKNSLEQNMEAVKDKATFNFKQ